MNSTVKPTAKSTGAIQCTVVLELVCVRDCIPKGKFMDGMGSMLVGLGLKKSHFAMRAYSPYFTVLMVLMVLVVLKD